MWRKRNTRPLLLGMKIGSATVENSMEVSQKIKNWTIVWPTNPAPGYISKNKNTNLKRCMHPNVHASIIYNSQDMEATQVSINRWMDKECVVYIYTMGYYSAIKKNEVLPFAATWMNLEGIMRNEISQTEKDKYYVTSLICGI